MPIPSRRFVRGLVILSLVNDAADGFSTGTRMPWIWDCPCRNGDRIDQAVRLVSRECMSLQVAIATKIHVSWHVGNQDKSGLVVLNVSFVARDPKATSVVRTA